MSIPSACSFPRVHILMLTSALFLSSTDTKYLALGLKPIKAVWRSGCGSIVDTKILKLKLLAQDAFVFCKFMPVCGIPHRNNVFITTVCDS